VDLRVLGQPYRESDFTGQTFITAALRDDNVRRVIVVTAWARTSGVRLLVPGLQALRSRGGTARLFVGVDLRGTSSQGVALARQHFNRVHAVHDPVGGTFHPKMYLALGDRVGYALIGSNNLTAGGLWHNYEAGVTAIFNPRRETEILDGIEDYARRLLADKAICKRVTQSVFDQLVVEGWLTDETSDRRRNEDRPGRTRPPGTSSRPPLFTASQVEKRDLPAPVEDCFPPRRVSSRAQRRLATSPDSWWKRLGAGDAQHPPAGHPTGNVGLTDVPLGHDRITFFRNVFFAAARWRSTTDGTGRRTELATIAADVEIGRRKLGLYHLVVVFRPYRSRRGRVTTVLRWGEALLPELRARDLTGWYLLIERGDAGIYRLRVIRNEPV
jgi:HKD family nuclease